MLLSNKDLWVISIFLGKLFLATSNPDGQLLKTNFAMPTQFAASQDVFDNTVTNFAQTTLSFDDTTP